MTDTVTQADFQREERYIVIKRKHLSKGQEATLRRALAVNHIETVECVVVEADWPEYKPVWQMIEDRVTGRSSSTASGVGADAVEDCTACERLGVDCGEHVPSWEQLAIYWRTRALQAPRLREALRKIDKWCCPVLCTNCADNRETARAALAASTAQVEYDT